MKHFAIVASVAIIATPALADASKPSSSTSELPRPAPPTGHEQPQVDLDKPITTTLRKLQMIMEQQAAACKAPAAKAAMEEMLKQATRN